MRIIIGNDHIGYDLKMHIKEYLTKKGHDVMDVGTHDTARTDYPIYAKKAAQAILNGECEKGILICGTGMGISIAANKVKGIRAAVCSESYSAQMATEHNNANIIAFGSRVVGTAVAELIVDAFINSSFEAERHQKRVDMISEMEKCETSAKRIFTPPAAAGRHGLNYV